MIWFVFLIFSLTATGWLLGLKLGEFDPFTIGPGGKRR